MADKAPEVSYAVPKESIDSLFKERDDYILNRQKKLSDPFEKTFHRMYVMSMNVLKRGGTDEEGDVKHTSLKSAFGKDTSHAEDLLMQYALKVGMPGTLGKTNAANIEAEYKKFKKTGKITDEFRTAHDQVKQHIEQYLGSGWSNDQQRPLGYDDIVQQVHEANLLSVFNPQGENAHPLHQILNGYVANTHKNSIAFSYRTNQIARLARDKDSPHHARARGLLEKLVGGDGLMVKKDADIKAILGEYDKIKTNPNYRPTPGKVFEKPKKAMAQAA